MLDAESDINAFQIRASLESFFRGKHRVVEWRKASLSVACVTIGQVEEEFIEFFMKAS